MAVKKNKINLMNSLVRSGALRLEDIFSKESDPSVIKDLDNIAFFSNTIEFTLLLYIIANRKFDMAKSLITTFNVNLREQNGVAPSYLNMALARQAPVDFIEFLLNHGADPSSADSWGQFPLVVAFRFHGIKNNSEIKGKIEEETKQDKEQNSVMLAQVEKSVIDCLLQKQPNLNKLNQFEASPLAYAVLEFGDVRFTKLLVENGARAASTLDKQLTAIQQLKDFLFSDSQGSDNPFINLIKQAALEDTTYQIAPRVLSRKVCLWYYGFPSDKFPQNKWKEIMNQLISCLEAGYASDLFHKYAKKIDPLSHIPLELTKIITNYLGDLPSDFSLEWDPVNSNVEQLPQRYGNHLFGLHFLSLRNTVENYRNKLEKKKEEDLRISIEATLNL